VIFMLDSAILEGVRTPFAKATLCIGGGPGGALLVEVD
jgi:hypothetical protein